MPAAAAAVGTTCGKCLPTCFTPGAKKTRRHFTQASRKSLANARRQPWLMQVALLDVLVRMDVRMGRSGALAARLER
jgi:hypothetical protein